MKDQVKKIIFGEHTEEKLNKVIALSDLLFCASMTEQLPESFSLNYAASELLTTAQELQEVYLKILDAIREQEQATA